jgi:hypothetical protein
MTRGRLFLSEAPLHRGRSVAVVSFWVLAFLIFASSLVSTSVTYAQTFQWPVSGGKLNQDYAEFSPVKPNNKAYHTGLDIGRVAEGTSVVATASGKVVWIQENGGTVDGTKPQCHLPNPGESSNCRDHGYGNTVIVEHDLGNGTKIYSQYSHLAAIKESIKLACGPLNSKNRRICSAPVPVTGGAELGGVGGSCYGQPNCTSPHLHFEIKNFSTLGTGGDDTAGPDGRGFGYTTGPPDQHGYHDPMLFLHTFTPVGAATLEVTSGETGCDIDSRPLSVRAGPSKDYDVVLTSINVGQQFVAFNRSGDWYQIHLPVPWESRGAIDGWVNRCYVRENPSATQLEVKNTEGANDLPQGLYVRPSPVIDTGTPIAKVWDGQRFVTFGTPTPGKGCEGVYRWRQIYLSQNAKARSGWVCDQWAQLVSSPPPSVPGADPIVIKGEDVPGISGEFFGFGGARLNNSGVVIFGAGVDTDGDGLSNVSGFFKESQGVKSKIVATGELTVTNIGTLNFLEVEAYGLRPAPINDAGNMVFTGVWDAVNGRHKGIFLASGDTITKLFQSGESVTVSRGTGVFSDVQAGPINNRGDIAFTASVMASGSDSSYVFLAPSGCRQSSCLVEVAGKGRPTGVFGIGGTFNDLLGEHLFMTTDGDVTFRAIVNGGSTTVAYLLFDRDTRTMAKIVAAGDAAPNGKIFNGVSSAHMSPNGRMVFLGNFAEPSPTSGGQLQGIYYISSVLSQFRQIKRVIEEGDSIPGSTGSLTLFRTDSARASVNGDGSVAFDGKFSPNASPLEKLDGVFVWTGGKFLQKVLEGTCTPVGGAYGGAGDPHINDSGTVVFFNPRIGSSGTCPLLAMNSLDSPGRLLGWAQIKKLVDIFLPSPARAQSASSNVGVYATVSSLDPDPDLFTLTVSREGTGSGIVTSSAEGIDCGTTCQASFSSNTEVILEITPAANSTFAGWSGDTDCADGQVTMDVNKTCAATFNLKPLQAFRLSVSVIGSGTVTSVPVGISCPGDCVEDYTNGLSATLTPAPATGFTFDSWSGNADCLDGSVTMDTDKNCTATFTQQFTFGANGGPGSVSVTVPAGQNWTAVSNTNWITITNGSSGNSNGTVSYTVAANTGGARTGTLTVAGQTVTISQARRGPRRNGPSSREPGRPVGPRR